MPTLAARGPRPALHSAKTAAIVALVLVAAFAFASTPARAGGACRGYASSEGTGTGVEMKDLCFVPTVLQVEAGEKVTWVNLDATPHSVAGATLQWGNYEERGQGESVSYRFDRPGTYPYYCFQHLGMVGAVVVRGSASNAASLAQAVTAGSPGPSADGEVMGGAGESDRRLVIQFALLLLGALAVGPGATVVVRLRRRREARAMRGLP